MTLSLEQFRERLVDYLYGQLEGEELRAFEAYLSESQTCREELAAMRRTLDRARQELREDAQEPPARVRRAVLAAAREHARPQAEAMVARARVAAPMAAAPMGAAKKVLPKKSAWQRAHASWWVPALGVAAVVSLFVFGRDVQVPGARVDERSYPMPEQEDERAAPSPAASAAAAPAAEPAAPESQVAEKASRSGPADHAVAREHGRVSVGGAADSVARAPAKQNKSAEARDEAKGYAAPPPGWASQSERRRAARSQTEDDGMQSTGGGGQGASANRGIGSMGSAGAVRKGAASGGAVPAPAQMAPAAPMNAPAEERELARDRADEGAAREPAAPVFAKPAPAASAAPAGPLRNAESSVATPALKKEKAVTREQLVARAQRQQAAGDLDGALASYRELLTRFANDRDAARWRQQLETVQRARAAQP